MVSGYKGLRFPAALPPPPPPTFSQVAVHLLQVEGQKNEDKRKEKLRTKGKKNKERAIAQEMERQGHRMILRGRPWELPQDLLKFLPPEGTT